MAGSQDKHGEEVVERRSADGRVTLIAAADLVDALVERGLLEDRPLAALAAAAPSGFAGRGAPLLFALPRARLIAKPMLHGGWLGALLHDRFLGAARVRELVALHAHLAERGVAVPRFAFARIRRALGSRRLDVATREIEGASDGLAFLRSRPPPAPLLVRAALRAAGGVVRALHDAGVEHADLNVKNLLVVRGPPAAAFVIDLEKSRRVPQLARAAALRNLERLARSAEKLGLLGGVLSRADLVRFAQGYGGADWRDWFRATEQRHRRHAPLHRVSWRLAGVKDLDGGRDSSAT